MRKGTRFSRWQIKDSFYENFNFYIKENYLNDIKIIPKDKDNVQSDNT